MAARDEVHEMAQNFSFQVAAYEAGRPSYPKALLDRVVAKTNLKEGSVVLDLAAGNGKLTRALEPYKFDLVAVEPSDGMREGFARVLPHIKILAGTATAIPFPANHFDAIFVGQAFHWFANTDALKEFRRVLKKGGTLILIWNFDDLRIPWVNDLHSYFVQYEGNTPQYRHGEWRHPFNEPIATELFSPLKEDHDKIDVSADLGLIWQRVLSRSYITALDKKTQDELKEKIFAFLRANVAEFNPAKGGKDENRVNCPYNTDAYWVTAL